MSLTEARPIPRLRLESLVVTGLFLVLYLSTISQNLSASHDSSLILADIDTRGNLFHPHHLLFNFLAHSWLVFWQWVGVAKESMIVVAAMNSLFGAMTLGFVYAIVRKHMGLTRLNALLATMLPAFSFGFWFYSDCVEVYIVPLFFLVVSLYLLLEPGPALKRYRLLGVTHALAILFHQEHALFGFVIILGAYFEQRTRGENMWKLLMNYLAIGVPLVVLPYLYVITQVEQLSTLDDVSFWLTKYSHTLAGSWNPIAISTFFKVAVGLGHAFYGLHYAFRIEQMQQLIDRALPGHWFMDEVFLVRSLSVTTAVLLTSIAIATMCVLCFYLLRAARRFVERIKLRDALTSLLFLWLLIYSTFHYFWDPTNNEFWIPQSVMLWLLFAIAIQSTVFRDRTRTIILGLTALGLFIPNYFGGLRLLQAKEHDYYYNLLQSITPHVKANDQVVIGREWILYDYIERYTDAGITALNKEHDSTNDTRVTMRVTHLIDSTLATGHNVVVLNDAVHLHPTMIDRYKLPQRLADSIWSKYRATWQPVINGEDTLYVIATGR